MLREVPRLMSESLGKVRIERLRLNGIFGFGDPALTGEIFGLAAPLLYAAPLSDRWEVTLRPDFDQDRLEGIAECDVALRPVALLGPLAGFGWRVLGPRR